MKRFALLLLACALTACSNTGNPYGNGTPAGGAPGTGAPNGNPAQPGDSQKDSTGSSNPAGQPNALMANAWCTGYHNQGADYQMRLSYINPQDYDIHIYSLPGGRRGPEVQEWGSHGNYSINGASLTMLDSGGQTQTYTVRIDPADAVTGAKKLHLTDPTGDAAFDPCY